MRFEPILAAILFCSPAAAEAPVVTEARQALAEGAARLAGEDLRGAEGALEQARALAQEAGESSLAIEVRLHLAELFARTDRMGRGLAAMTEAIAIADGMEAAGDAPLGPGVAIRVQLAELLRAHGHHEDAEAAAWDALGRSVALERLDLSWPALRLVLLSAVAGGAEGPALEQMLAEMDLTLSELDAYRLAIPPPPEPVAVGVEALGRQLLEAGQAELAAETFLALAALDSARDAAFRLPSDLARVSTAATLAGDRGLARWSSELALDLQGKAPTGDVLGAACAVALDEERWGVAEHMCGVGAAAAQGFAAAAMTARQAEAAAGAGRLDDAQKLRGKAQKAFEDVNAAGDALVEQAERALLLARLGRFEAADRELVSAVNSAKGTGAEPRVDEVRLRVALIEVQANRVDEERAQEVLTEVGSFLFRAERADDLAALAALHAERALAAGELDAALEAAEHAVSFESKLGLADEGWRALDVRARVRGARGENGDASKDRAQILQRANAWQLRAVRHDEPFFTTTLQQATATWPSTATEAIRRAAFLQRLGPVRSRGHYENGVVHADVEVSAIREALHAVSFRGSERPLDEVRAELEPELRQARAARADALAVLVEKHPRRAWLYGADVPAPGPVQGPILHEKLTITVEVFCPETWTPKERTSPPKDDVRFLSRRLAEVARGQATETTRPTLAELADLKLKDTVTFEACPSQPDVATILLTAGAASVEAVSAERPGGARHKKRPR